MSSKVSKPMYFSKLIINNIKCFGSEQELDLKDKDGNISHWTLILGENGVGKTTLLKCLSWMTPVESPIEEDDKKTQKISGDKKNKVIKPVDLKPFMDDFNSEEPYDQLLRIGPNINAKITATLANGTILGTVPEDKDLITIGMVFERKKGQLEVVSAVKDRQTAFNTINLFAYSASRHLAFKNIDNSELKDPIANLFSESGDLYDAEQLLSMLDNAARRHGKKSKAANLLKKVKEILVDLLPDIKHPKNIIINSQIREDGSINSDLVEIITDDGQVKLLDLSLGYKTMLAWIVDLAVRMLWQHPELDEPLKEPAVVIVDEVDLHLHPIWQRTVRQKLTSHFENTQFICTAHSPFMAQASAEENLCVVLRRDLEVEIINEPIIVKGWRIGQIATSELFNVPSERDPEVEKSIEDRRKLIDKQRPTEKDKADLKVLNTEIANLPVLENDDDQKLLYQIKEAAKMLRDNGIIQ
jgi:predicted ATP-binding protein involved in virulence